MNLKKLKLFALAVLVVMSCNLAPVDTEATATQVAVELFATQTAVAVGVSGTQTALAPPPTFTPAPTETPTETPLPTNTPEPTPEIEATAEPTAGSDDEPVVILVDDYSDPDNPLYVPEVFNDEELETVTPIDGRVFLETLFNSEDFFGISQITYEDIPQNFAVTVEIEFGAGVSDIGEAGILIRLTPDFSADYEFTITPGGEFTVYKYSDDFTVLVDYTTSSAIRTEAGAINQLTILADGPVMTFLINGIEVATVEDDDIHGGWLALVVYNFDDTGMSAYFDNLLVTNLAAYEADPPAVP